MSHLQTRLEALNRQLHRNMAGMKPLAKGHHTTGDWDYSNTDWQLNSSVYVSPPSSFQELVTTRVLIRTTVVPIGAVKEGRLLTWARIDRYDNYVHFLFRWQDASNLYRVRVTQDGTTAGSIYIEKIVAGVPTQLVWTPISWPTVSWRKIRVTWWNDYVGLVIRIEYWDGEAWIKWGDEGYDSENLWKDTGGRVGFEVHAYSAGLATYLDDTEIYGLG